MSNSIGSGGGTLQGWGDLIDTSLGNPPDIDPAVLLEGVFSPLALAGSAFFGEGASLSLNLGARVTDDLDPEMAHQRIEALFADIVGLPETTFGDTDVGQVPLLFPLAETVGLLPTFANGAAAAAPVEGSRLALSPFDLALPSKNREKREKVSNHPVAAQWHPTRNKEGPDKYTQGMIRKVWWQCEMGHEWEAPIYPRCRSEKPRGCPTCYVHPGTGSRGSVIDHPAAAAEWHPTLNEKGPEKYTQGSYHRAWWRCKNGHEWKARIQNRCKSNKTSGCRTCRSKNV